MSKQRQALPPPSRPPRGPDWRRLSRWALLGAIVMALWLIYPTVRCSAVAARDTPLGEVQDDGRVDVSDSDQERVNEGLGFFDRWGSKVKQCYAATPISSQEPWKQHTAQGLAAAALLFWLIHRFTRPRTAALD